MTRLLLCVALLVPACSKKDDAKPAPAMATVGKDGIRKIAITADKKGYTPDKIAGKPGEKLVLVFTRTEESECISQVKAPASAPAVDLPMNKPVEIAVQVPATGEVTFTCGMNMFTGSVVADPAATSS